MFRHGQRVECRVPGYEPFFSKVIRDSSTAYLSDDLIAVEKILPDVFPGETRPHYILFVGHVSLQEIIFKIKRFLC